MTDKTKHVKEHKDAHEEKLNELENNWKRALADYKNLEKRVAEEKIQISEFANMVLMQSLLPSLDNFEMVAQHTADLGLKLSVKEFRQVLETAGLEEQSVSEGDEFDATLMDAVENHKKADSEEIGKVKKVVRKGYKFKQKLIRPTSVVVG